MTSETTTASDQAAEATSQAWIPTHVGEQLVGEVVDIDLVWSDFRNAYYPMLTVRTDAGTERKFHAFRAVPYNDIIKWQPVVGERVVITYHGLGKAKAGMNPPHITRVRVEGRSSADARDIYRRLQAPEPGPAAEPATDLPADMPHDDPEPPF